MDGVVAVRDGILRIFNDMACKLDTAIGVVTRGEIVIPAFRRICHICDDVMHEAPGEGRGFGRDTACVPAARRLLANANESRLIQG